MCGRFSLVASIGELMELFGCTEVQEGMEDFQRYNFAPGQMVAAVIACPDGRRKLGYLQWGLIPSWTKDPKAGGAPINARAETLMEKMMFREAFERRRCLILCDGFYEWKSAGGSSKQPMRMKLKSRSVFAMAGIYDTWTGPDGKKVSSCAVITTTPNERVKDIHDRMPVILQPEDEALWLDREHFDAELLQSLLVPYPAGEMEAYPVSPALGQVGNDSAALIEPYTPPQAPVRPEQQLLF